MGDYARAGLGQSLGRGFSDMSRALMGLSARKRENELEAAQSARQSWMDALTQRESTARMAEMGHRRGQEEVRTRQAREDRRTDLGMRAGELVREGYPGAKVASQPRLGGSPTLTVAPGEFDYTTSVEYQGNRAEAEASQGERLALADAMAKRGLTPGGGRLSGPSPPSGPTISTGGRKFPDTPEGQRASLDWLRKSSEASRRPDAGGEALARLTESLGGEPNDAGPGLPSGRGRLSAQETEPMLPPITARPPPGREAPMPPPTQAPMAAQPPGPDSIAAHQAEWDAAYHAARERGMPHILIIKPHAEGGIGPRPGG